MPFAAQRRTLTFLYPRLNSKFARVWHLGFYVTDAARFLHQQFNIVIIHRWSTLDDTDHSWNPKWSEFAQNCEAQTHAGMQKCNFNRTRQILCVVGCRSHASLESIHIQVYDLRAHWLTIENGALFIYVLIFSNFSSVFGTYLVFHDYVMLFKTQRINTNELAIIVRKKKRIE